MVSLRARFSEVVGANYLFRALICAMAVCIGGQGVAAPFEERKGSQLFISPQEVLPLPPGDWRMVMRRQVDLCHPSRGCKTIEARAETFRNADQTSPIVGLVVRYPLKQRIRKLAFLNRCRQAENGYKDLHQTGPEDKVGACSFGIDKGIPKNASGWWWSMVRDGLRLIPGRGDDPTRLTFVLHEVDGRPFQIEVFLARDLGEKRLSTAAVMQWKREYMQALLAGLYTGKRLAGNQHLALKEIQPAVGKPTRIAGWPLPGRYPTASGEPITPTEPTSVAQGASTSAVEQVAAISSPRAASTAPAGGRDMSDADVPTTPTPTAGLEPSGGDAETKRLRLLELELQRMKDALAKMQTAPQQVTVSVAPKDPKPKPAVVMAPRYALVVGNAKYQNVSSLENTLPDAKAFAESLKGLGFNVTLHTDVGQRQFNTAVRRFKRQLKGGEEVVFYYAGHGVQLGSANYLLPTDVGGDSAGQVRDEAIELQKVLDSLAEQKAKFSLAVIDACRDNPFKQNGRAIGGRGLAPTTAATGQMVIFSAGAGQQALDKLGPSDQEKNGLFTRVFLEEMRKPGIPVDQMLRQVRQKVVQMAKDVGHEQVPALYDQAIGQFYFRPQ